MNGLQVCLAVTVVIAFLAAWRMESGWRIVLTPFLMLMYFELVRVLPPFFLAEQYAGIDRLGPLLVAVTAFLAIVLGFVAAYFHRPTSRTNSLSLSVARVGPLSSPASDALGVGALVVILVVLGLVFYGGLPPTVEAIFGMFRGGGRDLASMVSQERFALTKSAYFGGEYRGQGLIGAVQRTGWTMVLLYAVLRWTDARRNRRAIINLVAAILATWLFVAGDGTRGTFLNVMLLGVAVYSLRSPLSLRRVAVLFGAGLLAAILLGSYSNKMYGVFSGESGAIWNAAVRIIERIFIGNGINDVYVVDLVQRGEMAIRWGGAHLRDLLAAMPGIGAEAPLAHELYEVMNPFSRGTTFLSGTYISTAYVDFGWIGVIPIFFLAGILAGVLQRKLLATQTTIWKVTCMAVVAYLSLTVLRSGFIGFGVQLVVVAVLWTLHSFAGTILRLGRGRTRVPTR